MLAINIQQKHFKMYVFYILEIIMDPTKSMGVNNKTTYFSILAYKRNHRALQRIIAKEVILSLREGLSIYYVRCFFCNYASTLSC